MIGAPDCIRGFGMMVAPPALDVVDVVDNGAGGVGICQVFTIFAHEQI